MKEEWNNPIPNPGEFLTAKLRELHLEIPDEYLNDLGQIRADYLNSLESRKLEDLLITLFSHEILDLYVLGLAPLRTAIRNCFPGIVIKPIRYALPYDPEPLNDPNLEPEQMKEVDRELTIMIFQEWLKNQEGVTQNCLNNQQAWLLVLKQVTSFLNSALQPGAKETTPEIFSETDFTEISIDTRHPEKSRLNPVASWFSEFERMARDRHLDMGNSAEVVKSFYQLFTKISKANSCKSQDAWIEYLDRIAQEFTSGPLSQFCFKIGSIRVHNGDTEELINAALGTVRERTDLSYRQALSFLEANVVFH